MNTVEKITAADAASTRTARAAVAFGTALCAFLERPTAANERRMHAASAAFGRARAAEAVAKGDVLLAILATESAQ